MTALKRKVLDAIVARSVQEAVENKASKRELADVRILRRQKRKPINVRAIVHMGTVSKSTVIRDISKGGLGLSPADGLYPGCDITVALITGETKTGIVRWWLAGSCGVQFHEPFDGNDALERAVHRKASMAIA